MEEGSKHWAFCQDDLTPNVYAKPFYLCRHLVRLRSCAGIPEFHQCHSGVRASVFPPISNKNIPMPIGVFYFPNPCMLRAYGLLDAEDRTRDLFLGSVGS